MCDRKRLTNPLPNAPIVRGFRAEWTGREGNCFPECNGQHGANRAAGQPRNELSWLELNWAADAEFAHARLERGALHAKERGGAAGSGDAPLSLPQGAEDVLALGFLK